MPFWHSNLDTGFTHIQLPKSMKEAFSEYTSPLPRKRSSPVKMSSSPLKRSKTLEKTSDDEVIPSDPFTSSGGENPTDPLRNLSKDSPSASPWPKPESEPQPRAGLLPFPVKVSASGVTVNTPSSTSNMDRLHPITSLNQLSMAEANGRYHPTIYTSTGRSRSNENSSNSNSLPGTPRFSRSPNRSPLGSEGFAPNHPWENKASVKHLECFWWRTSKCKFEEKDCLYAHHETGHVADAPRQVLPGGRSSTAVAIDQNHTILTLSRTSHGRPPSQPNR